MSEKKELPQELSLENIVTTVVQIPGVKVNRKKFLAEEFSSQPEMIQAIVENGPIEAGMSQEQLA